ncbi:hypothetical protein ACKWTF_011004 [Chironomus riparius]
MRGNSTNKIKANLFVPFSLPARSPYKLHAVLRLKYFHKVRISFLCVLCCLCIFVESLDNDFKDVEAHFLSDSCSLCEHKNLPIFPFELPIFPSFFVSQSFFSTFPPVTSSS